MLQIIMYHFSHFLSSLTFIHGSKSSHYTKWFVLITVSLGRWVFPLFSASVLMNGCWLFDTMDPDLWPSLSMSWDNTKGGKIGCSLGLIPWFEEVAWLVLVLPLVDEPCSEINLWCTMDEDRSWFGWLVWSELAPLALLSFLAFCICLWP